MSFLILDKFFFLRTSASALSRPILLAYSDPLLTYDSEIHILNVIFISLTAITINFLISDKIVCMTTVLTSFLFISNWVNPYKQDYKSRVLYFQTFGSRAPKQNLSKFFNASQVNLYSLDLKLRLRNPEVELVDSIRRLGNLQEDTGRRGALVSTKQVETLQTDTKEVSTRNRFGPHPT